ncbi:hypothetical protein F6X51_10320 [Methylobacterium planeticum]|uniref:Uncharacterized protein n=2 Tax=Methylobacterium planeticum TaxID=2615211 RepID=A0A6N6MRK2_9HYPH|nr:hypothetical protein F6X51_10320 [Methylobacterium planeticum]
MFVYLWVLFGLFALHEDIVLRQHGIRFVFHGFALVNALVLAKVMLVAEDLKLGHRFQARPLIYQIVLEAFILATLFIAVHILEHTIGGLIAGETLAASVPSIGGGGMQGLFCVALILFVALIPFFGFRHISRELGPGRIKAMLFGRRESAAQAKPPV